MRAGAYLSDDPPPDQAAHVSAVTVPDRPARPDQYTEKVAIRRDFATPVPVWNGVSHGQVPSSPEEGYRATLPPVWHRQ